jgi:ankyrin repeat protein
MSEIFNDKESHRLIFHAISTFDLDALRRSITKTEILNERDLRGFTALEYAIEKGFEAGVKCLILAGANLYSTDRQGQTPLHLAIYFRRLAIVWILLKASAPMESHDIVGNSPLHMAAAFEQAAIIACLVESGAMVNSLNHAGQTPYHLSCIRGDKRSQAILLRFGANKNATDNKGMTVEMMVQRERFSSSPSMKRYIDTEAVKFLMEKIGMSKPEAAPALPDSMLRHQSYFLDRELQASLARMNKNNHSNEMDLGDNDE